MGIELETGRVQEEGWLRGSLIGAGASGTVSLAMNSSNGHLFAVKSAASFSVALENEYQILRGLDSPYIVTCLGRCFSVENCEKVHNLFMEYMPGGSVGDLLIKFRGQLKESVIKAYTHGILSGIDYLHRQGIVHCDIKGKNVLVGASGVKLADFGSAKRFGDEKKGQVALQLRGTPQWMAPEVVNQVEQGPASDIWSLGCTVLEMATGRPPWSQVSNPLAAMYRIGCTEELPELPASLSPQIRDFLEKCLRRDPKKRWTSVELLKHPFLNELCSAMEEKEVSRGPVSPTSNLDLGNQVWDSYSSETTPILSLSIPSPTGERDTMADSNKSIEQCPRRSPRERVMALASACEFEVADSPNWSASPTSQWIVVRSSRDKSPTSDIRLSKSDINNASSIQELPLTDKCSANLEAVNWEEFASRGESDECLDCVVSIAQIQEYSSCSVRSETLHHDLLLWSVTAHLTEQTREFYGYYSQSTANGDPSIQNRSILGETLYILNDKGYSSAQTGAACRPCCNMCSEQCSHPSMIKGQLCVGWTANDFFCNNGSKLIQIKFDWQHDFSIRDLACSALHRCCLSCSSCRNLFSCVLHKSSMVLYVNNTSQMGLSH